MSGVRGLGDQDSLKVSALQLDGSTYRERFVAPQIGEPLDDGLFTWTGPVVTAQERRESQARKRAERQRHRQFQASGQNMRMSRTLPGTGFRCEVLAGAHRWSSQGYDWQLPLGEDLTLGREGIEQDWNQLHPDEVVTNYRPPEK